MAYDPDYRKKHYLRTERNSNLVKQYGITGAGFDAMLKAIGKFADDPTRMLAAAAYVLQHADILAHIAKES